MNEGNPVRIFYDKTTKKQMTYNEVLSLIEKADYATLKNIASGLKGELVVINGYVFPKNAPKTIEDPDLPLDLVEANHAEALKEQTAILKDYEHSQAMSVPSEKQTVPRTRVKNSISRTVISLCLGAALGISGFIGTKYVTDQVRFNSHAKDVSSSFASSVANNGQEAIQSIVAQNTHRTDDTKHFWYDNTAIAQDILKLPDLAFDAALFDVYERMGINANNGYVDNFGRVICALSTLASPENNPRAYAATSGCNNFDEFAEKNGYIDEDGQPSADAYKEFGKQAIEFYYQVMQAANGKIALDEEEPAVGGRK